MKSAIEIKITDSFHAQDGSEFTAKIAECGAEMFGFFGL